MLFAHDTECALVGAAALVNTADGDREGLPDVAALDAFFTTHGWSGRHEHTETELRQVRALRPRLRRIWYADTDEVVAIVNRLLRESHALPQLVRHDDEPRCRGTRRWRPGWRSRPRWRWPTWYAWAS